MKKVAYSVDFVTVHHTIAPCLALISAILATLLTVLHGSKKPGINRVKVLLESSFIVIFHVSAFNNFIFMFGIMSLHALTFLIA